MLTESNPMESTPSEHKNSIMTPLLFPSPSKPTRRPPTGGVQDLMAASPNKDIEESLDATTSDSLNLPQAVFGLLNAMVGLSVLSLPYAFDLVGVATGLVALVLVIAVMSHTGLLVGSALTLAARRSDLASVPAKSRDFAFLASAAFGEKGSSFVGLVTGLEVWSALITFMAFNAVNSALLFPQFDQASVMIVSCILAIAGALLPMRAFSYVSLVSSLAVVATGVAVACACAPALLEAWSNGATFQVRESVDQHDDWTSQSLQRLSNLPRSFGIIIFCFAGHPCFPIMHECLRDRGEWGRVINISFLLTLFYYCAFGFVGCVAFGSSVQPSVIQNLATLKGPSSGFWQSVAAFAILVKVQLTAPLLLNTIHVSFQPKSPKQVENPTKDMIQRILSLTLLSALTGFAAILFSHNVAALASLTGSLLVMVTSVLFPILAFDRLSHSIRDQQSTRKRMVHMILLALGCLMAVVGTTQAVIDLAHNRKAAT